jgi:hypothetical protein
MTVTYGAGHRDHSDFGLTDQVEATRLIPPALRVVTSAATKFSISWVNEQATLEHDTRP